jgi:hypothetical protein
VGKTQRSNKNYLGWKSILSKIQLVRIVESWQVLRFLLNVLFIWASSIRQSKLLHRPPEGYLRTPRKSDYILLIHASKEVLAYVGKVPQLSWWAHNEPQAKLLQYLLPSFLYLLSPFLTSPTEYS